LSQQDQPESGGADNGFSAGGDAEFPEDGVNVELHGVLADAQSQRDGFVGQPFSDKAEDGEFARGDFLEERLGLSIIP
jgi:hypothetical protein